MNADKFVLHPDENRYIADQYFRDFRKAGIRIGTLDLRIAVIALAYNGT